ncbi:MAG: hypothetical protein HN559_07125, partial [Gemmatimonadetes bacterium]|nr:hypothetical protein [Gemmatimonadota bacterium]
MPGQSASADVLGPSQTQPSLKITGSHGMTQDTPKEQERQAQVVIIGGGVGGCAAALAAARG